jgi:hypothetical protein
MNELTELYKNLEEYSKDFDSWDNVEKFLETLEEIANYNNVESVSVLIRFFNDSDYTDYVYERLQGIIASYGSKVYVTELLKNLSTMLPHAKDWATGMMYGILNNKECLEILKQNIHLAQKEALELVLNKIYEESEGHRAVVDELRGLLK